MDEGDYGRHVAPEDFEWKIIPNHADGSFYGYAGWAENFESLLASQPVYVNPYDALAGQTYFYLSKMKGSIWADEARLRTISCPVLLAHGDEDYYLVGETNHYLEQIIPGASRILFESTGHLVNIERADRFNELLADHLRSGHIQD